MNSSSWPHKPDTHHAICFQCKDIQYITWCFAHISDLNLPKSINSQIELVQKNTFIEVVKSSIVCRISELLVPTFQLTKKCWLGFVPSASSAVQRGPALASFRYQGFHPGSSSLTQGNASHRSTNLFNTCCLANNPFPGPTSSFKMGQSFRWWMYTCKFQLLRVSENERQRLVYSGDSIQNFLSVRITSCSLSEPPSTIEVCVCVCWNLLDSFLKWWVPKCLASLHTHQQTCWWFVSCSKTCISMQVSTSMRDPPKIELQAKHVMSKHPPAYEAAGSIQRLTTILQKRSTWCIPFQDSMVMVF